MSDSILINVVTNEIEFTSPEFAIEVNEQSPSIAIEDSSVNVEVQENNYSIEVEDESSSVVVVPVTQNTVVIDNGAENEVNVNIINHSVIVDKDGDRIKIPVVNNEITISTEGQQGPPGIGIPTGGATGEVLVKESNSDYDTTWTSVANTIPNASSTVKGVTKLSINPVSSPNPVAVGDNDERVDYHRGVLFIEDGPVEGFSSGTYKQILPGGVLFPTQAIWWESPAMLKKIAELNVTWSGVVPVTEEWKIYDSTGSLKRTVTDSIVYVNSLYELNRTRVVV
jgi:hypothetical protein